MRDHRKWKVRRDKMTLQSSPYSIEIRSKNLNVVERLTPSASVARIAIAVVS